MKLEEYAEKLNGCDHGSEVPTDIAEQAMEDGVVIVYGVESDMVVFEGAIDDHVYAPDCAQIALTSKGIVYQGEADKAALKAIKEEGNVKTILTSFENMAWKIEFKEGMDVETFETHEDGRVFCIGMVFRLSEINNSEY